MLSVPYARLVVRVARELHIPLTLALQMPQSEFEMWAQVYEVEYNEAHAEQNTETDTVGHAMALLGTGEIKHRKQGEAPKLKPLER